ncbi:uncharacterized protein LOC132268473 [Cornus florida]|uniref:uncharacterized protein LOC132268473 n=1 Tax=Cornus florida TaxID=4283 RepID=UPI00289D6B1E|nr:uncharacterized protein LOC132268473 [Cornus florida]
MADQLLRQAIETDDITGLEPLLKEYLSQDGADLWEKNPLLMAFHGGSVNCAKEIVRLKPELAWQKNPDGSGATVIHFICGAATDAAIVKAVVEADTYRMICTNRDNQFATPFHTAAINGKTDVLSLLVTLCPRCIENMTSHQETALHLASKNNHCDSFLLLVEELERHGRMDLLKREDNEGNTVLHYATPRKQIQILKVLLPDKSTNAVPLVEVNSRNKDGFTALDLHYQNPGDRNDKDIGDILHQAGAKEGKYLNSSRGEQPSSSQSLPPGVPGTSEGMSWMMKFAAMGVFITIAGAAFASLPNLNSVYSLRLHKQTSMTSAKDLIMAPMLLPSIFAYMVFNTATFMASMIVILVIICSFKWSFYYRAISFFIMGAFSVSYAFLAKEVMPKFWISVASHEISSFWFVWLYDTFLACTVVTVCLMGKLIHYIFFKLLKRRWRGRGCPITRIRICV